MKRIVGTRGSVALILSAVGLAGLAAPASSLAATPGAVTRTFSFIAKPNSKTSTVLNIDGLLVNARCDNQGSPVMFAFSSASAGDLLGHVFDGQGRVHIIHNTSFSKSSKGVQVSPSSSDFDASGLLAFEASNGKVVTVNYAVDNATTLNKQNVCTVYGSYVAS
jgi:hypothetical protein